MTLRVLSYGGGVQSTALLVMMAQGAVGAGWGPGEAPALFANVGDDAENPATLAYVRDVVVPYAAARGVELVELRRHRRDGTAESLMDRIVGDTRSIPIPMRLGPTAAPGNRTCTQDFKIKVVAKECKRRGATRDDPAIVALGISLDEHERMRSHSGIPWQRLSYPLVDQRLARADCEALLVRAGLPVPPRSACFFCPYHKLSYWRQLKRDDPTLFARAVDVEQRLHARGVVVGRTDAYLTRYHKPLDKAVGIYEQLDLFGQAPPDEDGAACDIGGYCHA